MPDLFGNSDAYEGLRRSADFSPCGRYRYALHRHYPQGGNGKTVCFLMLNPSMADASVDDPTIRRCLGFVRSWGYSRLDVRNLFAFRATDPGELLTAPDPIGPLNNRCLQGAKTMSLLVVAWGAKVPFARDHVVLKMLWGTPLYCLGKTKEGAPRPPRYVKGDAQPILFRE